MVNRAVAPQDRHIVIAFVGSERLCKQLRVQSDGAWLVAGNGAYAPIKMDDDSVVWGVVTGRFAKVKA